MQSQFDSSELSVYRHAPADFAARNDDPMPAVRRADSYYLREAGEATLDRLKSADIKSTPHLWQDSLFACR
ncbi:MAG: hypothetical protein ACRETL_09665, partial [Gammaproteobacteria bacterium]